MRTDKVAPPRGGAAGARGWQARFIGGYGYLAERGMLNSSVSRSIFEAGYGTYKLLGEAGAIHHLHGLVAGGSLVIDVGANVGFFTTRFARWVQPGGRVLAIEPELVNADRLGQRLARRHLDSVVEVVRGVATDYDGEALLAVNPRHPGDHKIGAPAGPGVPVAAHTVDALVAARPARRVSLIKIDVQGAEMAVLRGAERTLAEQHPALFVEIHEEGLQAFGTSAAELIDYLYGRRYEGHRLRRGGIGPAEQPAALVAAFEDRYGDVLFLERTVTR